MKKYLQAEFLKFKHTTLQKIILLLPSLCIILAGSFCLLGGPEIIRLADITTLNHWGLLWLPTSVALLTGLSHKLEMKSTGYKTIYGFPIDPAKVWLAKIISIAVSLLASSFILWGFIVIFDIIFIGSQLSFEIVLRCLSAVLISWAAILWQVPLYLWLAQKINYFALIILSCGLSILVGPVYAVKMNWWTVPWAWILRFQAPILKLHPNGIPLGEDSILLSYNGFLAAIVLSVVLLISFTLFSMRLFLVRKGPKI